MFLNKLLFLLTNLLYLCCRLESLGKVTASTDSPSTSHTLSSAGAGDAKIKKITASHVVETEVANITVDDEDEAKKIKVMVLDELR